MEKIEKLVKFVVEQFAEHKDKIEYKTNETENAVELTVLLEEADMGKVDRKSVV